MSGTVRPGDDLPARGLHVLVVEPTAGGGLAAHVRMERDLLETAGAHLLSPRRRIAPTPRLGDLLTIREIRTLGRTGGLGRGPVHVIHAHGLRAGALAGLARGPRGTRPRLVVTLHNRIAGSRLSRAVGTVLLTVIRRRADAVLAVSPDLGAAARGVPDVRAAMIPATSAVGAMQDAAHPTAAAGTAPDSPLRVLAVGRLAPQKGIDTLLDAVALLHAGCSGVQVRIAGDGPEHDQHAQRIAAEGLPVELLGRRDDVAQLLEWTDLVVSSARWEGQPVFLQEAIHAGAAIVATDAGGTRLVTGEAARLVPVGDVEALAAAIADHRDAAVLAAARERSRRRSRELPVRQDLLDQLLDVLGG